MNIKIIVKNPPLGISENQVFNSELELVDWLNENKERLPNSEISGGILTYNRNKYENKPSHFNYRDNIDKQEIVKNDGGVLEKTNDSTRYCVDKKPGVFKRIIRLLFK